MPIGMKTMPYKTSVLRKRILTPLLDTDPQGFIRVYMLLRDSRSFNNFCSNLKLLSNNYTLTKAFFYIKCIHQFVRLILSFSTVCCLLLYDLPLRHRRQNTRDLQQKSNGGSTIYRNFPIREHTYILVFSYIYRTWRS